MIFVSSVIKIFFTIYFEKLMNCYSCHMQTNILFGDFSSANSSDHEPDDKEVAAVGAVCGFLYVIFNTLPLEKIMTVLAYRTELVPILWP